MRPCACQGRDSRCNRGDPLLPELGRRRKTMDLRRCRRPVLRTVHLCLTAAIAVSLRRRLGRRWPGPLARLAATGRPQPPSAGRPSSIPARCAEPWSPAGAPAIRWGTSPGWRRSCARRARARAAGGRGQPALLGGESVPEARGRGRRPAGGLPGDRAGQAAAGGGRAGRGRPGAGAGPGACPGGWPPTPAATAPRFLQPSQLATVGGIKVGVLGVADPSCCAGTGLKAEDPAAAAAPRGRRGCASRAPRW